MRPRTVSECSIFIEEKSKHNKYHGDVENDLFVQTIANDHKEKLSALSTLPNNNLNKIYSGKRSLLDISAMFGSYKCFLYLVEKDFPISHSTIENSIIGENSQIIKYIEETGVNYTDYINDIIKYKKNNLLDWVFKKLDGEIDLKNILFQACEYGNYECIYYCLNNECGTDHFNTYGLSPLHVSAKRSDYYGCKLLLKHGADANLKSTDKKKNTPLHLVCSSDATVDMVKLFLDFGANPNIFNSNIYHFIICKLHFIWLCLTSCR